MRLTLVRHGKAAASTAALGDDARVLVETGRAQVRAAAAGLASQEVAPSVILCSPLVRAVQTAEILAAELGYGETIEVGVQGGVDDNADDIKRVLIRARDQARERRAKRADIGGGAPESLGYSGEGGWDRSPERIPIETRGWLRPEGHPSELLAELPLHDQGADLLLAGHEPFMSTAASMLLGYHVGSFGTGCAFRIEIDRPEPGRGDLLWRFIAGQVVRCKRSGGCRQ